MNNHINNKISLERYAIDLIEIAVESICNKGCRQVRIDILNIKQQKTAQYPQEIHHLNHLEQQKVLQELQEIMATYGDTCRL